MTRQGISKKKGPLSLLQKEAGDQRSKGETFVGKKGDARRMLSEKKKRGEGEVFLSYSKRRGGR